MIGTVVPRIGTTLIVLTWTAFLVFVLLWPAVREKSQKIISPEKKKIMECKGLSRQESGSSCRINPYLNLKKEK
jgi:hypothetical protein